MIMVADSQEFGMVPTMSEVLAMNEFTFVKDLPKRERSRMQIVLDQFKAFSQIQQEKGTLVPAAFAAKMLGVCKQRVSQLMDEGVLERVDFNDHPFITQESILRFCKSARQPGRPKKTVWQQIKEAEQIADDYVNSILPK